MSLAAALSVDQVQGTGPIPFVITNWETGEGYIQDQIDAAIAAENNYSRRLAKMSRRGL